MLELFDVLLSGVGSFATAMALIFAIVTYRRTSLRERFARYRSDMAELAYSLDDIDNRISSALFLDMGREFRTELERVYSGEKTSAGLKNYILHPDREGVILRIHVVATERSSFVRELSDKLTIVQRQVVVNRQSFPVTYSIVDPCVKILTSLVGNITTNTRTFSRILEDKDQVRKLFEENADATYEDGLGIASSIVSDVPASYMSDHGQTTIDLLKELIDIVVERLVRAGDVQLAKTEKFENRFSGLDAVLKSAHSAKNFSQTLTAIAPSIKYLRSSLTDADWDRLNEVRTRLEVAVR